ncbi:hypothetical protein QM996_02400 [Sinorhizobium chiapasense]
MAKRVDQIHKGDTVVIRANVAKVWDNGLVTLHLPHYEHPVTIPADYLDEVIHNRVREEPMLKPRRKPVFDNPNRGD